MIKKVLYMDWWSCLKRINFLLVFLVTNIIVFRKFIFQQLLPIPSDILVGAYFPWLDNKWGYSVGVPVKNPLPSDIISMLYPWRVLGIDIIKQGFLPLWDNTILLGVPLLANFQAGLLNPFNLLFFIFSNSVAWSIMVFLQPILIGLSTYVFIKHLKLRKEAAVLGGLTFAFSGFSIVWMEYNTIGYTLACIPLVFFLIDRISASPKVNHIFFLSIILAVQFFSGYPQITIYTIIFGCIYFIYRLTTSPQGFFKKTTFFCLSLLNALLFASVQLLPSLELLQLSIRSIDTTAVMGGIKYLPFRHLLTLFIPDFFGNPATGNYYSVGSYDNFAFYINIISMSFAVVALTRKLIFNTKYIIFFLLAVFAIILSTDNSLSNTVSGFKGLGLSSAVSARSLVFFDFSIAIIAAVGYGFLLESNKLKLVIKMVTPAILLGIFIGSITIFTILRIDYNFSSHDSYKKDMVSRVNNSSVAFRNSVIPLILSLSVFIVVTFVKDKQKIHYIIIVLLITNITINTNKYLVFTPKHILYPATEVTDWLRESVKHHRFDRERGEVLPSNTWVAYGLKAVSGQNALALMSTAKYFSIIDGQYPNLPQRFVDITNVKSQLYDTLDIEYLALLNRDEEKSTVDKSGKPQKSLLADKLIEDKNISSVRIYKNSSNLGFAWFSKKYTCTNDIKIADFLLSKDYNPKGNSLISCDKEDLTSGEKELGQAAVVDFKPNNTLLEVNTPEDNYLTVSQSYYPGWKAYLNGSEVAVKKANLALTAIFIPRGSHTLKLVYEPRSFNLGFLVTGASVMLWVVFFSTHLVFKKRTKAT